MTDTDAQLTESGPPAQSRTISDSHSEMSAAEIIRSESMAAAKATYDAEVKRIESVYDSVATRFASELASVGPIHIENPDGTGMTYVPMPDSPTGFRTISTVSAHSLVPARES